MEQLFGYEQVVKRIANIRLTFVLLLWCRAVLYLLGTGAFLFWWMESSGTPEEGGIDPGRDSVGGYY